MAGSDGNLIKHAVEELSRTGETDSELLMNIKNTIRAFSLYGHSGASAYYAISTLNELLSYRNLTPLSGDDGEWTLVGQDLPDDVKFLYQNRRLASVFKEVFKDGTRHVYDVDGFNFKTPNSEIIYNIESHRDVAFPYHQKTVYLEVPEDPSIADCQLAKRSYFEKLVSNS